MKISLAEVVAHRELLYPREAAALTLAVGREWDRQRARRGDRPLPATSHIDLSDNGEIGFLDAAGEPPADCHRTLSALLGELLGIDEPEAPRQHVPGGLLMTIAGQVGPVELPSSREDGFRSALLRFADEDPGVLLRVFDRIASARALEADGSAQSRAAKVRRGPERRRQPPAVAALRRAVRDLERQAFEARSVTARRRVRGADAWSRPLGLAAAAAAGVALIVSALTFLSGLPSQPTRTSPAPVITELVSPPAVHVATTQPPAPAITPAKRKAGTSTPAVRPTSRTRTPRPQPPSKPAHVTFAGGARAITWTRATR